MASRETGVLPAHRRRALLDTAAREFAASGYQQASLNRIIRECGMSKSSFYHYFAAKDTLFGAVITEISGALVQALDVPVPETLRGADFWPHIARIADRLLSLSTTSEVFADLGKLFYLPDAPAGAGTPLGNARASIDSWLRRALETGRSSGVVRTDLPHGLQVRLTLAVLSAMDEWSLHNIGEFDAAQRNELAGQQLDAFRRLLAP